MISTMRLQNYQQQLPLWPTSGQHILAQFDENSIYVYQAYRPAIAHFAVEHQRFGGEFSFSRMSWIKPNFLWMMYRSGWATKEGQEHILALRLRRPFFDELLRMTVPSRYEPDQFPTREDWQNAVATSDVRLQWDPDHDPAGTSVSRRAVQLGLRGETLRRFAEQELLSIEDITDFVAEQRTHLVDDFSHLVTPEERIYRPHDQRSIDAIGLEHM